VKIPLNPNTKAEVLSAINTALESGKSYAVEIKLHDNSLKARQRALANIWYKQADEHFGEIAGYTEAYCKYRWGLVLLSQDDPDQIMMISRMLEGRGWEDKVEIIRTMSVWFPVMRAKGGLDAEGQALYLKSIQRHYSEQGLILSSPREQDLLNCRQAQR
jgi:hypothetical protein